MAGGALLGLVMAGPATAGGLEVEHGQVASALRPPVIAEAFRPVLACDENTTIGQEGCGEHQVLAADKRLDGDVTVVFSLLTGTAAAESFVRAETTWLTYRDEDCTSQSDVYQGGSEQPVAYVYCLVADDGSRRQESQGLLRGSGPGPGEGSPVPLSPLP